MNKQVHLIGIGGQGIYYLALYLHYLGWQVSGSDIKESEKVKDLQKEGIEIFIGHNKDNLNKDLDLVIASPGVPKEVEEIKAAKDMGLKLITYRQALDHFYGQLDKDNLSSKQKNALKKSNFAPLFFLDLGKTKLVGVTGTDGKTTTSTMIYHLLKESGMEVGLITTVMAKVGNEVMDTGLHVTTPSAQKLADILKKMLDKDPEVIILEITSHGLAHHRVDGLELDVGVFTNITSEHLDFHQTWEKYAQDKAKLIDMVVSQPQSSKGNVVLNKDDKSFNLLEKKANQKKVKILTYGTKDADLVFEQAKNDEQGITAGICFKNKEFNIGLPIQGKYNLYNASAALLAVKSFGMDLEEGVSGFKSFKLPRGRMEVIQKEPFWVIVDFAHTPNALEKALASAKQLVDKNRKLIVVFGAAGQRDKYKREKMGEIASLYADIIVLVPEDPRKEKTSRINDQIEEGISLNKTKLKRFDQDQVKARKQGINWAIKQAKSGDVVITCGKGHEQSLCFGTKEYSWDEIEAVEQALNQTS
jgi:UDP-N-acetylmuramoyl-L-alanyl-D-glutamate--2,6-diaminopimelate ligase